MIKIYNLHDKPQHLIQLANWHQDEWAHLNPGSDIDDRIQKMQLYLSADLIPSTFIAEDNNLLGSAAIVKSDMETNLQYSPWLASVFVVPEYRCNGTGTRLVKHVMQQAHNSGVKTLYLFTPDKTHFYQKLGWSAINKEHYHGHEVTIMKINLSGEI